MESFKRRGINVGPQLAYKKVGFRSLFDISPYNPMMQHTYELDVDLST